MRRHLRTFNNGIIFSLTYHGCTWLPRPVSYAIGHVGTWLAFTLMPRARSAVMENLQAVFPDRDPREIRETALATFRSFARDNIDFIRSLSMTRDEFTLGASNAGSGVLDAVLAEGKGAILATAHFGNYELGALLLGHTGYRLSVVVKTEDSPAINRMRHLFRSSCGVETIEVRQGLETPLQIRRQLAENRPVAMLLDRHLDKDRIAVPLFGRRAHFLRTPALMSYLTGAPLIPSFVSRTTEGRYVATSEAPIRVSREGDRDECIRQAIEQYAAVLEERIRQRPEHWYQFYPYWADQEAAAEIPLVSKVRPTYE